jgi:signal transduction histidine kinase
VVLVVVFAADLALGRVELAAVEPILRLAEMAGLLLVMGTVLRMTIDDLAQALDTARQEVAERKAAEAALARANTALEQARAGLEVRVAERTAELTQVIEASQDGILFVNPDGQMRVVNSCAADYLRLPGEPETWVGRSAGELVHYLRSSAPEAAGALATAVDFHADGDEAEQGEIGASPYILRWYRTPVTLDANELAYLVVLRDVTERRRMETLREDLIRALVHDLRNPLASIMTSLSLIAHADDKGTNRLSSLQRRHAENVRTSAREMVRLVDNILDVSRLETGQMPLRRSLLPASDLVAETVKKQRPLAAEKEIALEVKLARERCLVWVDPGLVARVLQNLLDNALKFTPAGGSILVHLRTPGAPAAGQELADCVQVSVSDSGPGIPPEIQDRIFDKFVSGGPKGSGLGLAFCKMAVEAHGGRIWLDGNSNNGARFAFTLPAASDTLPAGS